MSNTTYTYTDLKIRRVDVEVWNEEGTEVRHEVHYELVDDNGNVHLEFDL